MHPNDLPASATLQEPPTDLLTPLMMGRVSPLTTVAPLAQPASTQGVVVGQLLALADNGTVPLVRVDGQTGGTAQRARSVVDLHAAHIGHQVVLVFEGGDPAQPIVMGVLRQGTAGWPQPDKPAQVDVDADGQRLIVSAKEQLVLRCGKASITLTKAGKVLIEGNYLLSRSSGVNRIKGGSVQLN
jgi:Domain of unknown function (DUF6484)